MAEPALSQKDFGFGLARALSKGRFYISGVLREDARSGVHRSVTFGFGDAGWDSWVIESRVVGMALGGAPRSPEVIHVSPLGEVFSIIDGRLECDQIGDGVTEPSVYRQITDLARVGGQVFAVGMRRMVFRRPASGGGWEHHDQGALIEVGAAEISGFTAVGGASEDELYAAGYEGHLWACGAGGVWRRLHPATNVKLSCLCWSDAHEVLVGGAEGLLLAGRGDRWAVLDQDVTRDTFLSAAPFGGRVYLTTSAGGVFFLEGTRLHKDGAATAPAHRLYHADASEECLLAVGGSSIRLLDAEGWRDIALGSA